MSKSSELDKTVKQYILGCVNRPDPIEYIRGRFYSECGLRIHQAGRWKAMRGWLQGVSLPIAFSDHEILELARKWGSILPFASEAKEEKIVREYWGFMAAKVLQLLDGYRVPKEYRKRMRATKGN